MIRRLALAMVLAMPARATAVTLEPMECPFRADESFEHHRPECFTLEWSDSGKSLSAPVARFRAIEPGRDAIPVLLLPGGPGDAPVDPEGGVGPILSLFPARDMVMVNPRGTKGTVPRPTCTLDTGKVFDQHLSAEDEAALILDCRRQIRRSGLPLSLLETRRLADDASMLMAAMKIEAAGVFAVSYGTETALHLLARPPRWLRFAILDSVSLPGVIGTRQMLEARDDFLHLVDRLCFEEERCGIRTLQSRNLLRWAERFDEDKVGVLLGPDDANWALDSGDIIDFIAGLAAFPDGAVVALHFIDMLTEADAEVVGYIDELLEYNADYGMENLGLLYEAYSDSLTIEDRLALLRSYDFPFDRESERRLHAAYVNWNETGRVERPFSSPDSVAVELEIPVLVLSGGADWLTPVAWAHALRQRFFGFGHYVFPDLGHAVSMGEPWHYTSSHEEIGAQLSCAKSVIELFLASEETDPECKRYGSLPRR